jgi:hypothetical protein
MAARPNGGTHMPATWERVYIGVLYVLLAIATVLFLWDVLTTDGWRFRSASIFIIGWAIAVRLGAKWVPSKWSASLNRWLARGRLYVFCFNLLWIGFPVGVFGYLARWHPHWELLTLIMLMSVIPSLFMGRPDSKTSSEVMNGRP